jgi:hypothetical protein
MSLALAGVRAGSSALTCRKRQKMQRDGAARCVRAVQRVRSPSRSTLLTGTIRRKLYDALLKQAKRRTANRWMPQLDEEGKSDQGRMKSEQLKKDEGVVMVESRAAQLANRRSRPLCSKTRKRRLGMVISSH